MEYITLEKFFSDLAELKFYHPTVYMRLTIDCFLIGFLMGICIASLIFLFWGG